MKKLILLLATAFALVACATDGGGETVGAGATWRCDGGKQFRVSFTRSGARVSAAGRTYNLPHRTGGGARYVNGGVEYWERAGTASLTGAAGGPYRNCRR